MHARLLVQLRRREAALNQRDQDICHDRQCPACSRALPLYLGDTPLKYVTKFTYVGVTFAADERNICRLHYAEAKKKANKASWAITGAESVLKDLPPAIARLLYMARLDPILCSAADIALDVDDCVAQLEKIQLGFLR